MYRRLFTVGGLFSVAVAVGAAALFPALLLEIPIFGVWALTFLVSGVLAIHGGESYSVAGLSYVVFGTGIVSWAGWQVLTHSGVTAATTVDALIGLSALFLVWVGHDWIRGPRHFDLSRF